MKKLIISEEALQAILNHLGQQTYVVAQPLIEKIQSSIQAYEEPKSIASVEEKENKAE